MYLKNELIFTKINKKINGTGVTINGVTRYQMQRLTIFF